MKKTLKLHKTIKRLDSVSFAESIQNQQDVSTIAYGSGGYSLSKHEHTHVKTGVDPIDGVLDDAALGLTTANDIVYSDGTDLQRLAVAEQRVIGRLTGANLSAITIGIANDNMVQIDSATVADNDFAKFTANGLEGRSYAETLSDLSNTATATFDWNGQALSDVNGIQISKSVSIYRDVTNSAMSIYGGKDNTTGASITIWGSTHGSYPGAFWLGTTKADDTTTEYRLKIAGSDDVVVATWLNTTHTGLKIVSAGNIDCAGTGANGWIIKNPKNAAASALSGTQLDVEIDIGGTPYYFTVYPTKA